jgi:group I intron endonuclease
MPYIYKITNKINNKIYIGKTLRSIEERWKQHCSDYKRKRCEKRPLYSAMNKYGIENFIIEEVEQCEESVVSEREKYWIEYYGSFKYGYNATIGGDGKAYIDREKVINTYNQIGNIKETAKLLNISVDSVNSILKNNNIKILTSSEVNKQKYGKSVNMYNLEGIFLKNFSSLQEAANYMVENNLTGCKPSTIRQHISEVCRGIRKTAAKYKWEFVD